jgi:regulator of chromosome condensation
MDISAGDSHVAVVCVNGALVAWGTFRTSNGKWTFDVNTQKARLPVEAYTPVSVSGRVCHAPRLYYSFEICHESCGIHAGS